jgi:hypothetical protein
VVTVLEIEGITGEVVVAYLKVLSFSLCGGYEKIHGDSNLTSTEWKSEAGVIFSLRYIATCCEPTASIFMVEGSDCVSP